MAAELSPVEFENDRRIFHGRRGAGYRFKSTFGARQTTLAA
jgi:hypothetical protein